LITEGINDKIIAAKIWSGRIYTFKNGHHDPHLEKSSVHQVPGAVDYGHYFTMEFSVAFRNFVGCIWLVDNFLWYFLFA
jgi:hypothetical protein